MFTTARPKAATATGARRPAGPTPTARVVGRTAAVHAGADVTVRQTTLLIVQGTLVGLLLLAGLAVVVVFFGEALRARIASFGSSAGQTSTATTPGPTLLYRDRGDGTVMVMEIDGNGTRIKGVMNRVDVPMMKEQAAASRRWVDDAVTSQSRVNALGSAFR